MAAQTRYDTSQRGVAFKQQLQYLMVQEAFNHTADANANSKLLAYDVILHPEYWGDRLSLIAAVNSAIGTALDAGNLPTDAQVTAAIQSAWQVLADALADRRSRTVA